MKTSNFNIQGLTDAQVVIAQKNYGSNVLKYKKDYLFLDTIITLAKDPMLLLLVGASTIYFINGKISDAVFMLTAILFQISISLYQDNRSKNALIKLNDFSKPKCKVIRNGNLVEVLSQELVVGDSLMVEEGDSIAADGKIVHSNDFSVNESILTGESYAVFKDKTKEENLIFGGTTVASGLAIITISDVGNATKLGKIGSSLQGIESEKTPLEIQIGNFVKYTVIVGAFFFALVWALNYYHSQSFLNSLLQSLTIAMSILPEEIPVALTTFMALGAWRLMKMGVVVKQMKTVETLGSATVICTDKTGTITENEMSLARLYVLKSNQISSLEDKLNEEEKNLLNIAMFASEPTPFDLMEKALHANYTKYFKNDERHLYRMIHEYPLGGKPPMMTHIFENTSKQRIIAAKGAPEALMAVSKLANTQKTQINEAIKSLTMEGYRVLAIGVSNFKGDDFPANQEDLTFDFLGIAAFYDPPKKNIATVLQQFYKAGLMVKIITGDNTETTTTIANQIGFVGAEKSISGDELMKLEEKELQSCVMEINIFTRMFPEAKLKIINALKAKKQIVAMTGDGVNDGPALKAAHIGIAMGKKGTEIAKQAASLILIDDDLSKMVDAIAMGRKIYFNLKKAIRYIISIHIPIILVVFIPLALGWLYPFIFTPVHIIFLEIIMGPTCSIIYENEPIEKNTMQQAPKSFTTTFFNWKELSISIVQGLAITLGTLLVYQYGVLMLYNEDLTRTMTFTTLIVANIFLTLINRSFFYSIFTTSKYKNNMVKYIIMLTITVFGLILYVKPLTQLFKFESLGFIQLILCTAMGFVSVVWFEIVKWQKRLKVQAITVEKCKGV